MNLLFLDLVASVFTGLIDLNPLLDLVLTPITWALFFFTAA